MAATCSSTSYKITWVGFEDLNQAWYNLIEGIPPEYYTRANINFGWPARYEIKSCIEIFPAPQAAYTLWVKGYFGALMPFVDGSTNEDENYTSFDGELVFLLALANAKAARGQPDAQVVASQATSYFRRADPWLARHGAVHPPHPRAVALDPAALPPAGTESGMSTSPVALTVAGGGMTRLRVKGAALRNSLYQLTNGYVTQAQTVKVRPGTFRHTDLANFDTTATPGATFGLTWYKDSFHVFAAEEVTVPDGYTLHVLNHPAATQTVDTPVSVEVLIGTDTSTGSTLNGFSTGSNGLPLFGDTNPDPSNVGSGSQIQGAFTSSSGSGSLEIILDGGLLTQSYFTSVLDVESGITYLTTAASFAHGSGGTNLWAWSGVPQWPTSGTRHLVFDGGSVLPTTKR